MGKYGKHLKLSHSNCCMWVSHFIITIIIITTITISFKSTFKFCHIKFKLALYRKWYMIKIPNKKMQYFFSLSLLWANWTKATTMDKYDIRWGCLKFRQEGEESDRDWVWNTGPPVEVPCSLHLKWSIGLAAERTVPTWIMSQAGQRDSGVPQVHCVPTGLWDRD